MKLFLAASIAAIALTAILALAPASFATESPLSQTRLSDTITVKNSSGASQRNYPLQFGRPFMPGEIAQYPQVLVDSVPVLTQADVKNRYPDGSVKFSVISILIPSISSHGQITLSFRDQQTGNNTPLSK